ncbi:hypothetical protein BJ875DRAFT_365838 [Amylocarpus encephaloides]|uniref:Rap-GAP domain-containing protein n=1 Tax=Amylocarpus encephaloides TaxID=45428 RepID=A0A9P7YSZ6_9HELO|nr:hypothetical protein BJ875DRAFT_365838 [Amylocarpus encephaloides]
MSFLSRWLTSVTSAEGSPPPASIPASIPEVASLPEVLMSPPSRDVAQTPEPKSSGLASVFKSFASGNKLSRTPNAQTVGPIVQPVSGAGDIQSSVCGGPPSYERLFEQLKIGNPVGVRIATAESLRHAVQDYPLSGVTTIFKEAQDLIEPSKPPEARVAGFQLFTTCVQNATATDPERLAFFKVLTSPANPADFDLQLGALVELGKHGKDLSGFHYQIVPLLTSWLQQCFRRTAAARSKAGKQAKAKGKTAQQIDEEHDLSLLFAFIADVIKFSFFVLSEQDTAELISVVLNICLHTPLSSDLRACIGVIDAIITFGEVPPSSLPDCIKVISSIHCLVEDIEPAAWNTMANFSTSHNGQTVVKVLLDMLRNTSAAGDAGNQKVREVRGALSVLQKLFAQNGKERFPLVPFTQLVSALDSVTAVEHAKIDSDVMRLILSLFGEDGHDMEQNVMEEDWAVLFDVVAKCSHRALETSDGRSIFNRSRLTDPLTNDETTEHSLTTGLAQNLYSFITRIEKVMIRAGSDLLQREACVRFFAHIHVHLPESCATIVINHFMDYRLCYPSDLKWKDNVKTILGAFFSDRNQPTHIRLHALKAVTEVFQVVEMMDEEDEIGQHEDSDLIKTFVAAILDDIGDEKDIAILQETVSFAVAVAENADDSLFDYVIRAVRGTILSDRLQSPHTSPVSSRQPLLGTGMISPVSSNAVQTPSNVATKGLVQIFMKAMDKPTYKAVRVFEELLWIANSIGCEIDARISSLKMLFRLRADWANRLHLVLSTESEGLAVSLYRTTASLARKQAADEATQRRASRTDDNGVSRVSRSTSFEHSQPVARQSYRTTSGLTRIVQRNHQMWMYPDADALPVDTSGKASSLLASYLEEYTDDGSRRHSIQEEENSGELDQEPDATNAPQQDEPSPPKRRKIALNITKYLETITQLLQNGCDWEVYSFILVHLPSQLTNQALFRGSIDQIRILREIVCDLLKNNSFEKPPGSSGLRKSDVAICLFQILNMILGYHHHFSKADQDEIVRTFLQGIGSTWERTSKSCIHALSICSHEIPGSTSKALVTILQQMSTIITQSHVAIHILEFLACLARMPDLYVNFREEEYRTVFAICFRYLQYVRDQPNKEMREAARNSYPHARNPVVLSDHTSSESNFQPNTSDDLPQYVHALAYHVIIFWFLSLRLNDRAGQVSWIAKNLVSLDEHGKEKIDEQAQVTLDFMQRVAYADVDESAADPTFTKERFGEILKKRWIVGQSIVTVEQATRGGWAQITKRQPSGTSCYIIREKFSRPPPHQNQVPNDTIRDARPSDANMVLPSHLLLQLSASIPQAGESARPISLPSDSVVDRAVRSFDRNFTVDGHKVGVIYIGENQTQEVEILSNIMGSSEYTAFLSGLGTLTKLQGANFNTQGLDRFGNSDGEYAFCWRDRVTEIVFHVTTQMPTNLDHDPQCIGKKRHIGNDFVNIIFNNSGLPFRFDTFPSEFNYVNIVITPESRASFVATRRRTSANIKNAFYKVQTMSKPGFPEISPAAETKIMSLAALPGFIRLLALNASVFSLVWANKAGGEHVSSWRNRLREINRLREKYRLKSTASTPTSPPGTANAPGQNVRDSLNSIRRSSVANFLTNSSESTSQRSSVLSTAETEVGPGSSEESIVETLDFSRWA